MALARHRSRAVGLARLALAVVLTVVVISFSPTVTIAVLTENRARGPLSDVILTTVIFADLVLICRSRSPAVRRVGHGALDEP